MKKHLKKIKNKFKKNKVKIINNYDEIKNIRSNLSTTISAIPGIARLSPMIKLISLSDKILIANKEAIVCGWNLIKRKSQRK